LSYNGTLSIFLDLLCLIQALGMIMGCLEVVKVANESLEWDCQDNKTFKRPLKPLSDLFRHI